MTSLHSNPVTLATIAAQLGVSRSTVSNAYNHPDQLSPELRERILSAASRLGYTGPDPVARRLRQGKANALGVLFSERLFDAFGDPASILFLQGVAQATEEADSGLFLIPAHPSEAGAAVVRNAVVDGYILYSIPPGHPFVEAALRRKRPVVCVDQTKIGGVSWVGIDDHAAARSAAQYLVDMGHRKIAVIVWGFGPENAESTSPEAHQNPHPSVSWLRLQGYADTFKAAGLPWSEVPVEKCASNTREAGATAATRILRSRPDVTAVLCTSDLLAIGAIEGAKQQGVGVPKDLSVVGFNDLPAASECSPPLTTVRQPLLEKGIEAARMLLDSNHSEGEHNIRLESTLIQRQSTAPPSSP